MVSSWEQQLDIVHISPLKHENPVPYYYRTDFAVHLVKRTIFPNFSSIFRIFSKYPLLQLFSQPCPAVYVQLLKNSPHMRSDRALPISSAFRNFAVAKPRGRKQRDFPFARVRSPGSSSAITLGAVL
jgi:hypothetical protein